MLQSSRSKPDPPIIWAVVVDHRVGKFLSRMCLTAVQIGVANRVHIKKFDGIRIYEECEAIRMLKTLVPLGLDPPP